MRGSRKLCQRGSNSENVFFSNSDNVLFWLMRGERIQTDTKQISAIRQVCTFFYCRNFTLVNHTSIWWYLRVLPVLHRPEVVDIGVNTIKKNMPYALRTTELDHF